ncbi:MAG TPA: 7-cyano-7-deazaguanine synthase [Gemmataceae bacterium]|jgi:7-cyano-7-deazaguanine synthase|nr:7-cyano-7-deazaguanine synthase [Gemmataceae bacterium]
MTPAQQPAEPAPPLAVLVSGGLDSAVLLAESLGGRPAVFPLYVRFGLTWEPVELNYLRRFLEAIRTPALRPLHVLDMPVQDLYGAHWGLTGEGVPGAETPDEAVFLPGRNLLLLSKAMLWCYLNGVHELALAPLEANPFPDATPEFFSACEAVVNQAVGGRVRVWLPYRGLSKAEVLRRGRGLPLEWTFSCIRPDDGKHCGACNKCAERRRGFAAAGEPDPTEYGQERPCSA